MLMHILPLQTRHGGACGVLIMMISSGCSMRTFFRLVEVHALTGDSILRGEALLLADRLIRSLVQG